MDIIYICIMKSGAILILVSPSSFGWILEMAKKLISRHALGQSSRDSALYILDLKRESIMNM
nr:hypothetical protein Iba_chr14aCG4610 [Ipomoea batatas]GMD86958.1 hypothetical protein Iba_chr14bCG11120 [Ipomoea batatas]GMD88166.1 hypothetical protein Iba_chr14cCG4450 [Ipomoea batatas]